MSAASAIGGRRQAARRAAGAGREQVLMAGAQLGAGVANLGFTLLCVRLLVPDAYSHLAAFLAAYLLLYLPFSALAAAAAVAPRAAARHRRRVIAAGLVLGAVIAVGWSIGLAGLLGLPGEIVLTLAAAAPVAGALSLERGRAIGDGCPGALAGSLLVEPCVRLGVGVPAAALLGAPGATAAIVIAGYAAWLVALRARPTAEVDAERGLHAPSGRRRDAMLGSSVGVGLAYLLLAALQNQDVVWANARLGVAQAARFAVLSTIGGMAVFASTTVPLVLLARSRRPQSGALTVAVLAAAALGGAALLPASLDGRGLLGAVFGARYAPVAPLLVPYLGAMALLGVCRVVVAHRAATIGARPVLGLLAGCAVLQAVLIGTGPSDAEAVAHATLAAALGLGLGLLVTAAVGVRRTATAATSTSAPAPPAPRLVPPRSGPDPRARRAGGRRRVRISPHVGLVVAATLAGAGLRLIAGRSFWLDEATSVTQARMSFTAMLHNLQTTDVQPPLHDAILWLLAHAFGDSEAIMRSPSLLSGTLLIPVLYGMGRDVWDRRTGLIAAGLGALAPFLIWYSQEARMYALFMLFAALSLWGQMRLLRDPDAGRGWWWLVRVTTAALIWTQYFGVLFVAVQQLGFLIAMRAPERRRRLLAPWLFTLAIVVVTLVPLVPFAVHQFQANQSSGKGFGASAPSQTGSAIEAGHTTPTVYAVLTNVVWGIWGYHSDGTMAALTALWPLLMLLALALLGRGRSRRVGFLLALAGLPLVALFVAGQFKPFLFEIRYFCGGVPVTILLLARLCDRVGRRPLGVAAVSGAFAMSFGVAFADQQYSQANPRIYDFQGTLATIEHEMRPGDVLFYQPYYLNDLVHYYARGVRSRPLVTNPQRYALGHHVFLLVSFQGQPRNARIVGRALLKLRAHRVQIQAITKPEVQVWEFR